MAKSIQCQTKKFGPVGNDILRVLQEKGIVSVPHEFVLARDYSNLPGTPDGNMRTTIEQMISDSGLDIAPTVVYLPESKLGAVFLTEGNAACSVWRTFFLEDGKVRLVPNPKFMKNAVCSVSGANAQIAAYNGQALAILTQILNVGPTKGKIEVQISSWNGMGWDEPAVFTETTQN